MQIPRSFFRPTLFSVVLNRFRLYLVEAGRTLHKGLSFLLTFRSPRFSTSLKFKEGTSEFGNKVNMAIAEVFIIESLRFEDEKSESFEGRFLSQILKMDEKKPLYYYIRTKAEFQAVMDLFAKSDYRYLHVSCHGNPTALCTTLDSISFKELSKLLNPYLKGKRVFVSACSAVNDDLAAAIIPSSGCYSVVGPVKAVYFGHAAIVWASFYHLMFELDHKKMRRREMLGTLKKLVKTFNVPLDYFSTSKLSKGYRRTKIR